MLQNNQIKGKLIGSYLAKKKIEIIPPLLEGWMYSYPLFDEESRKMVFNLHTSETKY